MQGLTGRLALVLADGLRHNSVLQSLDIGDNGLNTADKTMFLTLLRKSKVSNLKMYVNYVSQGIALYFTRHRLVVHCTLSSVFGSSLCSDGLFSCVVSCSNQIRVHHIR